MARWPKNRRNANHHARATEMREHPRMWVLVTTYRAPYTATAAARHIRNGHDLMRMYRPPGAFETRTEQVDNGTALYARYTGDAR